MVEEAEVDWGLMVTRTPPARERYFWVTTPAELVMNDGESPLPVKP